MSWGAWLASFVCIPTSCVPAGLNLHQMQPPPQTEKQVYDWSESTLQASPGWRMSLLYSSLPSFPFLIPWSPWKAEHSFDPPGSRCKQRGRDEKREKKDKFLVKKNQILLFYFAPTFTVLLNRVTIAKSEMSNENTWSIFPNSAQVNQHRSSRSSNKSEHLKAFSWHWFILWRYWRLLALTFSNCLQTIRPTFLWQLIYLIFHFAHTSR